MKKNIDIEAWKKWFVRYTPQAEPKLRLICFPYAGGGPAIFHQWAALLPANVELVAVRLPGRETRIREKPFTRLTDVVKEVSGILRPFFRHPFAIFGHSVGALTAYELTQHIRQTTDYQPVHLLLSGHRAAHRPPINPPFHHLDEATFLERVKNFDGTPAAFFEQKELVELMLPCLRADFEVWETYQYSPHQPLDIPLTIYGSDGDSEAKLADFEAWKQHTTGAFKLHMFNGGHFYFQKDLPAFLNLISQTLDPHL